jgi:tetratricopeptide (TPR) repeat protein
MKHASLLRSSTRTPVRLLALAFALPLLAGCNKFQARNDFRKGNGYYRNQEYREALEQFQKGLELDPLATVAWRSVGLTAMALYRPGVEGEDNERLADVAIDALEKYALANPGDPKVEEHLITMLINAGRYDQAIERLEQKASTNGDPSTAENAIVAVMIKANRLADAVRRVHRPGTTPDPQLLYSIGVAAWARSYGDPTLDLEERTAVVDLGLGALREALDLKPDYFEAMAYYNLVCREKAKVAIDPLEGRHWQGQADEWMQRAIALRDKEEREENNRAAAERTGS